MQLDSVESRFPRTARRLREQPRQTQRQLPDMRQIQIRDSLTRAEPECLELACFEHALELVWAQCGEPEPYVPVGSLRPSERFAVPRRDLQILLKIALGRGPPPDREEIDELDQEPGLALAGLAYDLGQLTQP